MKIHEENEVIAPGRRRLMVAAAACCTLALPCAGRAHGIGIVDPPVAIPAGLSVACSNGRRVRLRELLQGRQSLVQLMFTGCSETCPLQGALFAAIQARLATPASSRMLLLSLSIDPMDDARSLSNWLRGFGAGRSWIAAVPSSQDIDVIRASLQDRHAAVPNHSSQVYFIDESMRLIWRTEDLPSAEVVIAIARHRHWIA